MDDGQLEPRVTYVTSIEIYCLSCSWKQELGNNAADNLIRLARAANL
jgi:hypothetical protein